MRFCEATIRRNGMGIRPKQHEDVLPFLRLSLLPTVLSVVLALATSSTSLAQGNDQPNCEDDRSVRGCVDEILTEQNLMIAEVEGLLGEMGATGLFSLGQGQPGLVDQSAAMEAEIFDRIITLRNQNERAKEANDASTDAEYEEMIAESDKGKDKEKNCKDSDINFFNSLESEDFLPPGFLWADSGMGKNKLGNNKCDVFDATDLYGNDVTVSERAENMCAITCKFKKDGQGKSRKGESKRRVVDSLLDAKFTAGVARKNLSLQRAQMAAMRPQMAKLQLSALAPTALTTDVCTSGFDVPALLDIISTGVSIVNSAVAFTTAALETAKDNVKPAANQTVAGFNAGSTVIPFALVAGISKMTGEVIGGIEKILVIASQIAAASQEQTLLSCMASVSDEFEGPDGKIVKLQEAISQLQVDAGQTNTDLGLLKTELGSVKAELVLLKGILTAVDTLLRTPQGQREGFPNK
jgi:hypothetical protein